MNRRLSLMLLPLLHLVLLSCADQHILIDRVLVKNATNGSIANVTVRHEPTNKFGSVSAILPQKELDIGSSRQPLLSDKASISWQDSKGRDWSARVMIPDDRTAAKTGESMNLVYTIYPSGEVAAQLEPPEGLK